MFSTDEMKGFLSHALERSQLRLGTEPGAVATGSRPRDHGWCGVLTPGRYRSWFCTSHLDGWIPSLPAPSSVPLAPSLVATQQIRANESFKSYQERTNPTGIWQMSP